MDVSAAAASPPLPPGPPPPGAASGSPAPASTGSRASHDVGFPLEVHISVKDRNHKGAATVKFLRQAEAEYPALTSVLCVQKAWLYKKGLRGVYKGGIGSYSLALLALHELQRKAHDDASLKETDAHTGDAVALTNPKKDKDPTRDAETLGASLLHFLEFYGQQVNLTKAAVVAHPLRPTGKAAKKATAAAAAAAESPEWGVVPVRVPGGGPLIAAVGAGGLTVSDPTQPGHNAGGGCFGIAGVQTSFGEQLATLAALPEDASLLGALLSPAAPGRGSSCDRSIGVFLSPRRFSGERRAGRNGERRGGTRRGERRRAFRPSEGKAMRLRLKTNVLRRARRARDARTILPP